jgi:mannitol/fructose-specific phosphotransferase system IIA component (Ntr-type)
MKLNERGEIVDPQVHDAELVRMEFDPRRIDLHIELPHRKENLVLRLANPRWMSFSTNHSQNVIDKIVVTTDLSEAAALAPQYIREMLWRREQTIPGQKYTVEPLKAIYITPASGPVLSCISDDVTAIDAMELPQQRGG